MTEASPEASAPHILGGGFVCNLGVCGRGQALIQYTCPHKRGKRGHLARHRGTRRGEKPGPDSSLAPPMGAWPCRHLDLRLMTCRGGSSGFLPSQLPSCWHFAVAAPGNERTGAGEIREGGAGLAPVTKTRAVSPARATWRPAQAKRHFPERHGPRAPLKAGAVHAKGRFLAAALLFLY